MFALVAQRALEPSSKLAGTKWVAERVAIEGLTALSDDQAYRAMDFLLEALNDIAGEARHAHKTVSRRQDGFKAHLGIKPDAGVITGCQLTKAAGPQAADGTVGVDLLARDDSVTEPVEVLGDSAYGTGEALDELDRAGHVPLVKPWPIRPTVPGVFDLDDFTVNEHASTLTCPNNITRPITPKRSVTFGAACRGCPLRQRCTTAKDGRTMTLHQHDALQRAHRQRATDPQWQVTYRQHRPMVERSIAWLVANNNRKVRYYRGAKNINAWLQTRTAALNLRRLVNLGLTRHDEGWALA